MIGVETSKIIIPQKQMMKAVVALAIFALIAVASAGNDPLEHTKCEITWEKVGCFKDKKDRTLPELLVNDRDENSKANDGHKLNWTEWEESLHSLACRCAQKARDKGYKVFGLQFYGECWSGPDGESDYMKYGEKSSCIMWLSKQGCDKEAAHVCVGKQWTNYVYRLKEEILHLPTDGGYTDWGAWTECSKTCGGGSRMRQRTCTNPEPSNGGKDCSELGSADQSEQCNDFECPKPCTQAIDLGVILDMSMSIPESKLPVAKGFVVNIARVFQVQPGGTHMGLIVYSRKAKTLITFNSSGKQSPRAVKKTLQPEGRGWGTNTDIALTQAGSFFTPENGDRANMPDVLIVITDGKNRGESLDGSLRVFKKKRVNIFAIGVGRKDIDHDELKQIALGEGNHVLQVDDFDTLNYKLQLILDSSCPSASA